MKKRNITTRTDAVTKDMVPEKEAGHVYSIPSLGISVRANTMNEALAKTKEIIKDNKK